MKRLPILALAMFLAVKLSAQTGIDPDPSQSDTLSEVPQFTLDEARDYVDHVVQTNTFWLSQQDSLRKALQRLLDHSMEPFDSTRTKLMMEDFTLVEVKEGDPLLTESIDLRWLNDSTFLVDPQGWSPDLYLKKEQQLIYPEDTASQQTPLVFLVPVEDQDTTLVSESTEAVPDTVIRTVIDTSAIESLGISLHSYRNMQISPTLDRDGQNGVMSEDRSKVLYYHPGIIWKAAEDSPFDILEGPYQLDSLQYAVNTLLEFTSERDSTLLFVNDMFGHRFPLWLSQGNDEAYRFWVKNHSHDSITVWIGNTAPNEIGILLEDGVNINRLEKENIEYLPEFVVIPERTLVDMKEVEPEPIYWDFGLSSSYTLNQTYLSNWTKGGESSFATLLDLLGEATYNNKESNAQWINTMRINFGTISTKENGFRKNQDEFEINSKYNQYFWGKIGMSASLYMKTQLANGYNYPNDSVVVSRFLNPASMTVGLGFEYKPFKNTSLNLAPLSYKNTFVLDTALIDQTKFGIEADKKAMQEMGIQLVFQNKITPFKDMSIENNLRLFSNYLNKPQNVDVDWEMNLEQRINWFFTIRLNLHLIYDDDIRFSVFDSEGNPVLEPDGSEKSVAKAQFREFIGLSMQFKF
jgi:hypothetical protein